MNVKRIIATPKQRSTVPTPKVTTAAPVRKVTKATIVPTRSASLTCVRMAPLVAPYPHLGVPSGSATVLTFTQVSENCLMNHSHCMCLRFVKGWCVKLVFQYILVLCQRFDTRHTKTLVVDSDVKHTIPPGLIPTPGAVWGTKWECVPTFTQVS